MLKLFDIDKSVELYSDENIQFIFELKEILENKQKILEAEQDLLDETEKAKIKRYYKVERKDNKFIIIFDEDADLYGNDVCDTILNNILKKLKPSKTLDEIKVYCAYRNLRLPYRQELSYDMDTLLLDDLSLDFDDYPVMKDAIFLDAYSYIFGYYNEGARKEIPLKYEKRKYEIQIEKIEDKAVGMFVNSLPQYIKRKIVQEHYSSENIYGDYISTEQVTDAIESQKLNKTKEDKNLDDLKLHTQVNYKQLISEEIQIRMILDAKLKQFLCKKNNHGKIFKSAKELYESFCRINANSASEIKCKNITYFFVERLMGFNLALAIYQSVVKFLDGKQKFEDNPHLISMIRRIVTIKSPTLRYWTMMTIGDKIKKARLCEYIKSDEDALKEMKDYLEEYVPKVQKLHKKALSLLVQVINCEIEDKIAEYRDNSELAILLEESAEYESITEKRAEKNALEVAKQFSKIDKSLYKRDLFTEIYGILALLDEKIEYITREHEAFYLPEYVDIWINNSESLRALKMAKEESYEYRLFSYIMRNIVEHNL